MADDLIGWPAGVAQEFGRVPLQLGHSLNRSALFSNEALARLIEGSRRENYYVNTMDPARHDVSSRPIQGDEGSPGEIADCSEAVAA